MMTTETVRTVILSEIADFLREEERPVVDLKDDDELVENGLDSLGFAVLITRLENSLGYDPFLAIESITYPRNVRELIDIYASNQPPAG